MGMAFICDLHRLYAIRLVLMFSFNLNYLPKFEVVDRREKVVFQKKMFV